MIWLLNSTDRIPMVMSVKNEEKPARTVSSSLSGSVWGAARRRVHRDERKCPHRTRIVISCPRAVASPAPSIPIPAPNTKYQSPTMLKIPPAKTAAAARAGAPSFRRKAARNWLKRNSGMAGRIHRRYACAFTIRKSSAPNRRSMATSQSSMTTQITAVVPVMAISAAVKQRFPSVRSLAPRAVLISTEPPVPKRSPRL